VARRASAARAARPVEPGGSLTGKRRPSLETSHAPVIAVSTNTLGVPAQDVEVVWTSAAIILITMFRLDRKSFRKVFAGNCDDNSDTGLR
jgi:hypothetical protein